MKTIYYKLDDLKIIENNMESIKSIIAKKIRKINDKAERKEREARKLREESLELQISIDKLN